MKKKGLLVLALFILAAGEVFAQSTWYNSYAPAVAGNNLFINAGIGFGPTAGWDIGIPPISATVDYKLPVSAPISIGALAAFTTWKRTVNLYLVTVDLTYTNIGFGARGMYHFSFMENLDTYAGLTLGYVIQNIKYNNDYSGSYDDSVNFFLYGGNIGARYFFTDIIGAYLELGYTSLSYLSAGVTFKVGGGGSGSVVSYGSNRVSSSSGRLVTAPESDFTVTLGDDNNSAVITRYNGRGGSIIIPDKIQGMPVVRIYEGAFRETRVTEVVVPEGVIEIGANAFSVCSRLTRVTLPTTIQSIGSGAFNGCGELREVSIPGGTRIAWNGNTFVGNAKLLLASQARLKELGYTGSF